MLGLSGRWVAVALIALLPGVAGAIPTLEFAGDNDGGTLAYDGAGGILTGAGIHIETVQGIGTPANSGDVLACVPDCLLSFTTGTNISEGAPGPYSWNGGGTFTLTGTLKDSGSVTQATGTLLSGSWVGEVTAVPNGAGTSITVVGSGLDTKNDDLLDFFGILPILFAFDSTVADFADLIVNPTTKAFAASSADLASISNVATPEPATLFLLGAGLSGLGLMTRRRSRRVS